MTTLTSNDTPYIDVYGSLTDSSATGRREVVIVDGTVADWQTLVAGISPATPMLVLHPDSHGLGEIEVLSSFLSQYSNLDAIHLVTEGRNGALLFGNEALWQGDLAAASPYVQNISNALKPGGDLMLYGCSVAGGAGQQFVSQLGEMLGHVDVAASTDRTGPTALGGDWDLEYHTGNIETVLPFTLAGMQDISHCLGCTVGAAMNKDQLSGAAATFFTSFVDIPDVVFNPTFMNDMDGHQIDRDHPTTWNGKNGYFIYNDTREYPGPMLWFATPDGSGPYGGSYASNFFADPENIVAACNSPTFTSAAYDAKTHVLTVTGTGMTAGDSIDETKLTITGQGGNTYTLTESGDVTASDATSFSININPADQLFIQNLLNKNGTTSADNTPFNLAGAENWDTAHTTPADVTNTLIVSGYNLKTIHSSVNAQLDEEDANLVLEDTGSNTAHSHYVTHIKPVFNLAAGIYPGWYRDMNHIKPTSMVLSGSVNSRELVTTYTFTYKALNGTGNTLDNEITGSNGSNILSGLDGNDTLTGLDGNDQLLGGLGHDVLDGGLGRD
ncbi:MAG: hypothetical protein RIQ52_283, partial [Pseudomonadota bacterium]